MRIAIIDIGTNTFNLLIVDLQNGGQEILLKTRTAVKLGEGGLGHIASEPFKRGTEALRAFNQLIEEYKVDRVYAYATSAVRCADNGADFVHLVKKKLGIHIEVIDGQREANLIYQGVRDSVNLKSTSLILDIGGGSNELILANEATVFWKESYPLGVTRLFEDFKPSDPISSQEIERIETFLETEMASLFEAIKAHPPTSLVGASGSFPTFQRMIEHQFPEQASASKDAASVELSMAHFDEICEWLIHSTLAEREANPAIESFRVEYIVVASILTRLILRKCGISKMHCSYYNLKEGAVAELRGSVRRA